MKVSVTVAGWIGVPSGSVNSNPVRSTQTSPVMALCVPDGLPRQQRLQRLQRTVVQGNGAFAGVGLGLAVLEVPADLHPLSTMVNSRAAALMSSSCRPQASPRRSPR